MCKTERIIPRRLKIQIPPTFKEDAEYVKAWDDLLDTCPVLMMDMLIKKRTDICNELNVIITTKIEQLDSCDKHADYHTLYKK